MKEEEPKIPFIEQSKVLVEISREPKAGPVISWFRKDFDG